MSKTCLLTSLNTSWSRSTCCSAWQTRRHCLSDTESRRRNCRAYKWEIQWLDTWACGEGKWSRSSGEARQRADMPVTDGASEGKANDFHSTNGHHYDQLLHRRTTCGERQARQVVDLQAPGYCEPQWRKGRGFLEPANRPLESANGQHEHEGNTPAASTSEGGADWPALAPKQLFERGQMHETIKLANQLLAKKGPNEQMLDCHYDGQSSLSHFKPTLIPDLLPLMHLSVHSLMPCKAALHTRDTMFPPEEATKTRKKERMRARGRLAALAVDPSSAAPFAHSPICLVLDNHRVW